MTPDPRDPDPLRPPDPEPLPVAGHQGCARWWLLWLAVGAAFWAVVIALIVANRAAPRPSPQPSPVETTAGAPHGARQAGAGIETRPWPRPGGDELGSPMTASARQVRDLSRRILVPELPIQPSGAPPLRGFATWCGPTPTQCQSWGGDAMLGAVPSFRFGDEPYRVTVSREGRQPVTVLVVSFCACGDRHGVPTLIDLSPRAFAALAPLSRGVVRVEVAPVPWKGME